MMYLKHPEGDPTFGLCVIAWMDDLMADTLDEWRDLHGTTIEDFVWLRGEHNAHDSDCEEGLDDVDRCGCPTRGRSICYPDCLACRFTAAAVASSFWEMAEWFVNRPQLSDPTIAADVAALDAFIRPVPLRHQIVATAETQDADDSYVAVPFSLVGLLAQWAGRALRTPDRPVPFRPGDFAAVRGEWVYEAPPGSDTKAESGVFAREWLIAYMSVLGAQKAIQPGQGEAILGCDKQRAEVEATWRLGGIQALRKRYGSKAQRQRK